MELIDKKAALKALYLAGELINKYGGRFYEGKFYGCQSAYEIIKDMPTVEERDKGYWIDINLDTSICSVCRNPQEDETKYCPECGRRMEGKDIAEGETDT